MYASNGLTLIGEKEVQLGGPLQSDTRIEQNNFNLTFTGKTYFEDTLTVSGGDIITYDNISASGYVNTQAIYLGITVVNATYTVQPLDRTVSVNNTGFVIITLPQALDELGRIITVKRFDNNSTANIRITSVSGDVQNHNTFSFGANTTLIGTTDDQQRITFQSDGTRWHIISK